MSNQKGFANIALIVLVVVLAGVAGYFVLNNRSATPTLTPSPAPTPSASLLRVCPEKWYDNRMPSTTVGPDDIPNEYFIYKGVRRELSEFDGNWVKSNCSVRPFSVY